MASQLYKLKTKECFIILSDSKLANFSVDPGRVVCRNLVAAGLAGPVGVVLQRIRRKVESDRALQAPDGPQVGLQGHNSALINLFSSLGDFELSYFKSLYL